MRLVLFLLFVLPVALAACSLPAPTGRPQSWLVEADCPASSKVGKRKVTSLLSVYHLDQFPPSVRQRASAEATAEFLRWLGTSREDYLDNLWIGLARNTLAQDGLFALYTGDEYALARVYWNTSTSTDVLMKGKRGTKRYRGVDTAGCRFTATRQA